MSTLFHVSDLHFGREDAAALAWFAAAVRTERPDAVLLTGDLTSAARPAEWEAASTWLAALGVPLTIEVGNHDLPYFNLWARFVRPYARFGRLEAAFGAPLDLADAAIVPLRTTARFQWRLNWAQGYVTPARTAAAAALLAQVPVSKLRIVTCHHPLYDRSGERVSGRTRGGAAALAALAAAGADVVLSGHTHDAFDIAWTGGERPLRLIGAGTLSERLRTTRPSFNVLTIADASLDVAVRTMP